MHNALQIWAKKTRLESLKLEALGKMLEKWEMAIENVVEWNLCLVLVSFDVFDATWQVARQSGDKGGRLTRFKCENVPTTHVTLKL